MCLKTLTTFSCQIEKKKDMAELIRSRYPKTSLKAVNLVLIEKQVGILKDAIEDDVEYLLVHFRSVKYINRKKNNNKNYY